MKSLKQKRTLAKLFAVAAISAASMGAQAATSYTYNGVITACTG